MENKQIKISSGLIEGLCDEKTMVFKGIPYAKAPVGELRWKAPQPVESWTGVKSCTSFSNIAPQPDMTKNAFYGKEFYTDPNYPIPSQSEDCLYLNVWAPSTKVEGGAPVAVWIHGGAFDHGFNSEMQFDGTTFAEKGVILVTINYRLGILGYLALEELADKETGTVGNYGELDQVAALQWVHDNIAAFGGDINRVTVFGQSAGAISVQALLSSKLTDGLVNFAIMQSGAGYNNHLSYAHTKEEALKVGETVKELLGVTDAKELYNIEPERFVEIIPQVYEKCGFLAFRPVVDGYFLTDNLDASIRKGLFKEIPVIIGSTSQDITVEKNRDAQDGYLYQGCINMAHARKAPTYIYYFNHALPGDDAGAFHSSELWYVFNTLKRSWRPFTSEDSLLSRRVVDYWVHFFKFGYPSEWDWPACNEDQKIPYIRYIQ